MSDYSHRHLLMENIYNVQLFPDISALVEENVQEWKFITMS